MAAVGEFSVVAIRLSALSDNFTTPSFSSPASDPFRKSRPRGVVNAAFVSDQDGNDDAAVDVTSVMAPPAYETLFGGVAPVMTSVSLEPTQPDDDSARRRSLAGNTEDTTLKSRRSIDELDFNPEAMLSSISVSADPQGAGHSAVTIEGSSIGDNNNNNNNININKEKMGRVEAVCWGLAFLAVILLVIGLIVYLYSL